MDGLLFFVSPLGLDKFLADYWGRKSMLIKNAANTAKEVFGWQALNRLLAYGHLSAPTVEFFFDKQPVPYEEVRNFNAWMKKGATLIINGVQGFEPRVDQIASLLGRDLNTTVNVNAYISWASRQGFDVHYDRHDIFALQTAGRKTWRVYEPTTVRWPVQQGQQGAGVKPGTDDAYHEYEMEEGDVLYIPRGHWHYAVADVPSIHLTFGPQHRTAIDFLEWFGKQLVSNETLRRDFPTANTQRFGGTLPDQGFLDQVKQVREQLLTALADENILAEQIAEFVMATSEVSNKFDLPNIVQSATELSADDRFELVPEQKVLLRYDVGRRNAHLQFRGKQINFLQVPECLINALFTTGPHTGTEVLQACPDTTWESLQVIVFALLEHGIVRRTN